MTKLEYDELARELQDRAAGLADNEQLWIGVVGGPGSGKSTLAAELKQRLGSLLVVIPQDGYHYYRSQLDQMEDPVEAHRRRGAPFTFDAARLVNDLIEARKKGHGSFPSFDHRTADPVENDIQLSPEDRIVLVEGNYLLLDAAPWNRLRKEVFDETWYLDVSVPVSSQRVMQRHMQIGLTEDEARKRVDTNDGPNAELISRQSPGNADRIIHLS